MAERTHDSKHMACARCRDRKVKCDGGRPGCRRCVRSRTPCLYVRGCKPNTRGEWLQHTRTFSSQPGEIHGSFHCGYRLTSSYVGRTNKTCKTSTPSYRTTPRESHIGQLQAEKNLPCYARSPSPFLLEHRYMGLYNSNGATSEGSSVSSLGESQMFESAPSWPPTPVNCVSPQPRSFAFEPAASFADTHFTSNLLTTTSIAYERSYIGSPNLHTSSSQNYGVIYPCYGLTDT